MKSGPPGSRGTTQRETVISLEEELCELADLCRAPPQTLGGHCRQVFMLFYPK
ncbi:Hypothetical protein SMAX5B_010698 [Scophthalmus maximus]|uniref:Uncharacterized protein n=1 Tax=Scophthalmus maximus TaxID=52904 RepID=A0A2U9C7P9_SCOMX|nr:Hypothetical protein SMAX5B_010698 [Scophthalmus maximus]